MKIEVKTLTPVWTGGVNGQTDRIHETGILGSLRWWYEAIVRGLGGEACDPSQGKCSFDADKYAKSRATNERERLRDAGLCDVCQVFGATGWRRRFRLAVVGDDTEPIWTPADRMLNIRPPDRNRGWFLPPGRMGRFVLDLDGDGETLSLLAALFLFLEKWGNIGARPQLGYGLFTLENREQVQKWARWDNQKPEWGWKVLGSRPPHKGWLDLRGFGFFQYRFQPSTTGWWTRVAGIERAASQVQPLVSRHNTVPVAPAFKNEWRFHRWRGSRKAEANIFGALRPRQRSKISVSWAYPVGRNWQVRGWAWLASSRWAEQVWAIVTDPKGWETVLKVQGNLTSRRVITTEQVHQLLEAAND